MKNIIEKIEIDNSTWFKTWFNSSLYHSLYAHRDENEAAKFIDTLIEELKPQPGASMLDLGCGNGRHSKCLAGKGFDVTGIDLASSSIKTAKKFESASLHFFRHDMRVPFGKNHFDYIFNFFTSFGYFETEEENNKVIDNISTALKPGGTLLLDYINTQYSEDHLVAEEQKEIDGIIYSIARWTNDKYFFKKIIVETLHRDESHVEKVAKLELDDFDYMLNRHGLEIQRIYGDYFLNSYKRKTSPRLIILAKKS
ncbi:MAG TPA: class I SAM-dependent methyltransferase [Chitinophagaceae bacterium]|jgi:SAM-dependent methyltransferase|nr:class I SAM-dependent methyltransferase [Chitinophagaceae bacterium]